MKVYVDGENLRHRLVGALLGARLIESSDMIFSLNVPALLELALNEKPESISYYTTRIKQPKFPVPQKLAEKIGSIQESHRRWIAELTNQGVRVVKSGQLKVRESSACIHCGKKTLILQEKGVDVRLATDMVMAAIQDKTPHIVVLSSDADMIPALEVVRHAGSKITYLCFAEEVNRAIAAVADQTITYTRQNIIDVYKRSGI
jgi:uncharacterized LabA/DUF88 family protein